MLGIAATTGALVPILEMATALRCDQPNGVAEEARLPQDFQAGMLAVALGRKDFPNPWCLAQ